MGSSEDRTEPEFSLELLQAGDRAEFARLVETYSGVIYRLAVKLLANEQDAEDVLQETFIKAYKHLGNFNGRSKLSTWLYRIASNEALMLLRKRKQVPLSIEEPVEFMEDEQEPLQIKDWCCLPEPELMSAEARKYLDKALEDLPPSMRVVFLLREIEGLSTRETSEILELSESAVKTRLSRARMRLRDLLTSYYGEKLDAHKEQVVEGGRQ
ncbi:MAG: sigma-70 family RNA polymerase sigma factor [Anaerolineales bacterium]|jgi:RNA polymerase sigma-70 factor (ECF subfamily)